MWWKSVTFTKPELRVISFLFGVTVEEAKLTFEDYFIFEVIRLAGVEKFTKVINAFTKDFADEITIMNEYFARGPFFKKVQAALYFDERRN